MYINELSGIELFIRKSSIIISSGYICIADLARLRAFDILCK